MKIDLSAFRETFFEECAEHLATMETALLELEKTPRDSELLNCIFRGAHSIKGASGTFGFQDVSQFTHGMESLLDRMRDGVLEATPPPHRAAVAGGGYPWSLDRRRAPQPASARRHAGLAGTDPPSLEASLAGAAGRADRCCQYRYPAGYPGGRRGVSHYLCTRGGLAPARS
jgi:HPt (histidine-containing phosphotransfer) domain-containing protein